jgi:septal ring factor EnvC (AmiA/AmiB activator)
MGPGGPGGMFGASSPEAESLRTTLDSANASNDEIKAKLAAYREAQKKNEAALQAAREKLRAVLTVRQEAQLVLAGVLE